MEFYGEPTFWEKSVTDNMSVSFKVKLENLADIQLTIIAALKEEGMSDNQIRSAILNKDQFVKKVEEAIWSRI